MDCHESLMQRRRKKKTTPQTKRNPPGIKLDKSLPAIPPSDDQKDALKSATRDEAYANTSTETSDRGRQTDYPDRSVSEGSQGRQATDQGQMRSLEDVGDSC